MDIKTLKDITTEDFYSNKLTNSIDGFCSRIGGFCFGAGVAEIFMKDSRLQVIAIAFILSSLLLLPLIFRNFLPFSKLFKKIIYPYYIKNKKIQSHLNKILDEIPDYQISDKIFYNENDLKCESWIIYSFNFEKNSKKHSVTLKKEYSEDLKKVFISDFIKNASK